MTVNSVRLGPEIDARLNELARQQCCSRSDIIRWALVAWFERHDRTQDGAADSVTRLRVVAEAAGWKGLLGELEAGNDAEAESRAVLQG
ncbi:MAG: hypothetical protein K0R03_2502 [Moraxellaceae bacterium]|jgi:predicted DNA-binding protein|nr:hypothetical protein [Moraxellaceae bacterium]